MCKICLLLILANFGLPLSCGFIEEFLCLFAAFDSSVILGVLALCGGVLSGQYIYGGIYWLGLVSILFTGGYSIRISQWK